MPGATRSSSSSSKSFEITASLEDYLEAIKELIDSGNHAHAHTSDIARKLKVKMPSVTNALGVLRDHGFIHYDTNYPVTLTEAGAQVAERVIRRHRVLKDFLSHVLNLDPLDAGATACRIEHVIDDTLISRLEVLTKELTAPRRCVALRRRLKQGYCESLLVHPTLGD